MGFVTYTVEPPPGPVAFPLTKSCILLLTARESVAGICRNKCGAAELPCSNGESRGNQAMETIRRDEQLGTRGIFCIFIR